MAKVVLVNVMVDDEIKTMQMPIKMYKAIGRIQEWAVLPWWRRVWMKITRKKKDFLNG